MNQPITIEGEKMFELVEFGERWVLIFYPTEEYWDTDRVYILETFKEVVDCITYRGKSHDLLTYTEKEFASHEKKPSKYA